MNAALFDRLTAQKAEERFNRLAAEWKKDTFLLSKITAKVSHMAYCKIIGMGMSAVPFMLKDLEENGPNHWFFALQAITEENPVPSEKAGNMVAMTEAWLAWGRRMGCLGDYQSNTKINSH